MGFGPIIEGNYVFWILVRAKCVFYKAKSISSACTECIHCGKIRKPNSKAEYIYLDQQLNIFMLYISARFKCITQLCLFLYNVSSTEF